MSLSKKKLLLCSDRKKNDWQGGIVTTESIHQRSSCALKTLPGLWNQPRLMEVMMTWSGSTANVHNWFRYLVWLFLFNFQTLKFHSASQEQVRDIMSRCVLTLRVSSEVQTREIHRYSRLLTWQPALIGSWIESEERSLWIWIDFKLNQNKFTLHRKLHWDKGKKEKWKKPQEASQRTEQQNHKLHWQNIWCYIMNLKCLDPWGRGSAKDEDAQVKKHLI